VLWRVIGLACAVLVATTAACTVPVRPAGLVQAPAPTQTAASALAPTGAPDIVMPSPTVAVTASPALPADATSGAPAGWWPYTAGARHFALHLPPTWELQGEYATGVVLKAPPSLVIGIDLFDYMALGSAHGPEDLAPVAANVVGAGRVGGESVTIQTSEWRDEPLPMVYLEYLTVKPATGWREHRVLIYVTTAEGWSLMAMLQSPDAPPEPDQIEALLQALATLSITPEERVPFYSYPDDVDNPASWVLYGGPAFTLQHPSSWQVVSDTADGVWLEVCPQGDLLVVVLPDETGGAFVGDPEAIEALLMWLVVTDGEDAWAQAKILDQGSRQEPFPLNYMELSQVNAAGATGHRVFIKADLGNGHAVSLALVRHIGLFAPGELQAAYTLLTTIVTR
jgi:hypothetical protein